MAAQHAGAVCRRLSAPFYFEELRGFDTLTSGLLLTPLSLTLGVVAPLSGALADRAGLRWLAPAGLAIASRGLVLLTRLDATRPTWYLWRHSSPSSSAWRCLRGSVVLAQFWTYTCINWLRFEHDLDNVRRPVKDLRVDYPVAIDNDYAIWDAFDKPLLAGAVEARRNAVG